MLPRLKTAQGMLATFAAALAIVATWRNLGLPWGGAQGDSSSDRPVERFDEDTPLLVFDQAWWRASPLGMLWPEMDARRPDGHPCRRAALRQEKYEAPASSRAPSGHLGPDRCLGFAASRLLDVLDRLTLEDSGKVFAMGGRDNTTVRRTLPVHPRRGAFNLSVVRS